MGDINWFEWLLIIGLCALMVGVSYAMRRRG